MAEWLVDPITWTMVALVVVLSVVFGRLRREPAWAIAASTIGVGAFLIGVRWAADLSNEGFWAAALTSGGLGLWVWATNRVSARQVTHDVKSQP